LSWAGAKKEPTERTSPAGPNLTPKSIIRAMAMKNNESSLPTSALNLACLGWHIMPLHHVDGERCSCGKADCKQHGKHPRTTKGLKDATANADAIRSWWRRWPVANVGVRTGPESGVWMVGPDGEAGIEALAELVRKYSGLPRTPTARSGSGGRHYYFKWPAEGGIVNRRNHHGLPIDVRGRDGLVVAPPSRNKNGSYRWEIHPSKCEPADAPGWLIAWAKQNGEKAAASRTVTVTAGGGSSIVDRAIAYLARIPPAVSGQGGHNQTMDAARVIVWGFDLGPEFGYSILAQHYNPRCDPPWSERELRHKCAEANTVDYGKPRGWLLNEERNQNGAIHRGQTPTITDSKSNLSICQPVALYRPFPTEHLPGVVRRYVEEGAKSLNVDPALIALPALATLASCIGNTRRIAPWQGWREPSVLWTVVVADSGTLKSPAYDLAVEHLKIKDVEYFVQHKKDLETFSKELREYKAGKSATEPSEPKRRRVVCSDVTLEKLAPILAENPRGLLVTRDELANWFGGFKRYKQGGCSDAAGWLELHRAGILSVDRLGRGSVVVPRAGVSITGTIQGRILRQVLSPEHRDSGLAARLLLAMPPASIKARPTTHIDPATEAAYSNLIDELLKLGSKDNGDPYEITLSTAATKMWNEFYDAFAITQNEAQGDLKSALAKQEGYAARLALVIHTVSRLPGDAIAEVTAATIKAATSIVKWFAYETERVYGILSETHAEASTRDLIELIQARGACISGRDLNRYRPRKYPNSEEAEKALDDLVRAGLGRWAKGPKPIAGPTPRFFRLNVPIDKLTSSTSSTEPTAELVELVNLSNEGREPPSPTAYIAPGEDTESTRTPFDTDAA